MRIDRLIKLFFFLAAGTFVSCDYLLPVPQNDFIIAYKDAGLTQEELLRSFPEGLNTSDSLRWVNEFIDEWLLNQALKEKAQQNLDESSIREIDDLVSSYQNELYTQQYARLMVQQKLDTSITDDAIAQYYSSQQEDFRLNEELIQVLYFHVDDRNPDLPQLKKWFKEGDSLSFANLESYKLSFKGYNFNDSIWLNKKSLLNQIAPLNLTNEQRYLAPGRITEISDSTGVYNFRTIKRLGRGDQAPLSYVVPTIRQILLNKEKLKYVKKLKTDLLNEIKSSKEVIRYDE